MAYIKQTFRDDETVLTASMLDKIQDGILDNEQNISNLEVMIGNSTPSLIKGDEFIDKFYYYGNKGDKIQSITASTKACAYKDPIPVTTGQQFSVKLYSNATYTYILTDENDIIMVAMAAAADGTVIVPKGAAKLYVNTLMSEKSNSFVDVESTTDMMFRQLSDLLSKTKNSFQFNPIFDLSKVPDYKSPDKTTILGKELSSIYGQYDALVETYPNYVSKINCDDEVTSALNIERPSELDSLPIYMYKFSPVLGRNSGGYDQSTKKKIFITSMHPQEKLGIWVMAKTMAMICEEWKTSTDIEQLRSFVDIYVMPIAWPYNFYNGKRINYNNINPNRNFPTKGWYETAQGQDYSGAEAGSEYETKVIMHYFHQIKPDVTIDVHTSGHDNNGCMGIILCRATDLELVNTCCVITRTVSNAAIKDNPTFTLNDPNIPLYGVYPEQSPPPGEFYQWASEQEYGVAILTEESPYCNWKDGEFLGADGKFVEEYTDGIFRQQIQYLFNVMLRLIKHQC